MYYSQFIILFDKRFTGLCVKFTFYNLVKLFQYCHWYCVFSVAGMAELHPEECRSSLYRVGQRRQVGNSDLLSAVLSPTAALLHYLSTLYLSATFQFHHSWITSQPLRPPRSPRPLWWGGYSRFWTTINDRGGWWVKRRLGEWGWKILEFKAPFNTCSSQRDLRKGERLGRRWQGPWSLVPLWHLGNRSWFPTVRLSV